MTFEITTGARHHGGPDVRVQGLEPSVKAAQMALRRSQPSESRELSRWIGERHYSGGCPSGYRVAFEVVMGRERIGGMLLGRPSARGLDPDRWLELTRMFFIDETPMYVESRGLALMRKQIRIWYPMVRMLLAYSDPSQGHEGTVYEADGWAQFGKTSARKQGWENRPNRKTPEGPYVPKLRWLRSP